MTYPQLVERINDVHCDIIKKMNDNHKHLVDRLNEWKNGPNPYFKGYIDSVILFVDKYLEWETKSSETRYWKRIMFKEVIQQETDIFGPLLHFIGHEVYDDGSFTVKWYKDCYEIETKEIMGHTLEIPTSKHLGREEVEPASCFYCYPVVLYDYNHGTQNPQEIVDAMILHEKNQQKAMEERMRECAELDNLLKRLQNK